MDVLRGVRTLYISTMYIVDNQTVKNMYKPKSLSMLISKCFDYFFQFMMKSLIQTVCTEKHFLHYQNQMIYLVTSYSK